MNTATLESPVQLHDIEFHPDPILSPEVRDDRDLTTLRNWCLERAGEWYKMGLHGPARDFLRHATDIDPHDAQTWIALGSLEFEMGVYDEAGLAFHRAAQQEPINPRIYLHLALTHEKLGNLELAEGLYDHALVLSPANPMALSLTGNFFMNRKRHDRARPYYEQLLQQRPDDVDILLRLGVCNYRIGDTSTARQCFERVLRIQPANEVAMENLDVMKM